MKEFIKLVSIAGTDVGIEHTLEVTGMKNPCNCFILVISFILSAALVCNSAWGQLEPPAYSASFSAAAAPGKKASTQSTTNPNPHLLSTSMTGFGVPFKINDEQGRFIEVQLYVSKDRGNSWQFYDRKSPLESEFPFRSQGDGEYWFALKTLDRDRKLHPDGNAQPELKVIVDTRKPTLDLAVKSDQAGRVVCRWKANDPNISVNSLRISYQPFGAPATQWTAIEYQPIQQTVLTGVFMDELAWWPAASSRDIVVKLDVSDQAGNFVSEQRRVMLPQMTMRNMQSATANRQPTMQCEGSVCRIPDWSKPKYIKENESNHLASNRQPLVGSVPEFWDPPPPNPTRDVLTAANPKDISLKPKNQTYQDIKQKDQIAGRSTPSISWESQTTDNVADRKEVVSSTTSGNQFESLNFATGPASNEVVGTGSTVRSGFVGNQFVNPQNQQASGSTDLTPITPPSDSQTQKHPITQRRDTFDNSIPSKAVSSPGFTAPPDSPSLDRSLHAADVRSINSRRFLLDYNVDSIDPSGVGKVVLWVTRDQGETWQSWSNDNDNQSPFPVEMEQDGTFGFRVVIHSNDGIAGRPPARGDDADMWVRIDSIPPKARIISVPYGTGNDVGRLVINWTASDESLRTKPVKFSYSTNSQGPWTEIENGLRNTGRFAWKVPRGVPDRIFLKMEVFDEAGNRTVQQLTRPIDISGLVPRGRINGVKAIPVQ